MASKLLKPFVRREILARQDRVGRVVSQRELKPRNSGGSPVWVCDVDIGANRLIRNVPIKATSSAGARFYAERGQTVLLRRNTQGRYDIVGPADRLSSIAGISTYEVGDSTALTAAQLGFTFQREPFEFYQGPTPPTPGTSLWNDGVTPFPLVRILDADGNEV